ncbi:MAG: polysaccharide biosynthesis/export family protein [Candidatus Omnitrophica bacterium]|nr:polysaccharide biosynthesis/export family protein [Candidatus Omnitrophota bacterium]
MKKILFLLVLLFFLFVKSYCQPSSERIKPNDILNISFKEAPDLNKVVRVSKDGTILLKLLGKIYVENLSVEEATLKIAQLLKQYYFLDTTVTIKIEKESFQAEEYPEEYLDKPYMFEDLAKSIKENLLFQTEQIPIYKIMPYDTLKISVYGEPDLSATLKVSEEGTIRYALLGEIKVEGLTADEAAKKIEELLKKGYLVNPKVSVSVEEHAKIFVFGEVNQPGSYEIKGPLTLVDAIVLAGGLKEEANPYRIKVVRVFSPFKGAKQPIREFVVDLKKEGKGFYLYPLDKIIIEKYGKIFIVGAVKNPGVYKLERSDLTISDAITFLAGGPLDNANISAICVTRAEGNEKKEYIINLFKKDGADFIIKEEDRILIKKYEDISVFGQVKKPGNYSYKRGLSVVDIINLAGGFTDIADKNAVRIVRKVNGKKKSIKVPVGYILKSGDKSKDVLLEPADTVVVPESWL